MMKISMSKAELVVTDADWSIRKSVELTLAPEPPRSHVHEGAEAALRA
ncbi:MAG: hypothetical protein IT518_04330 [Burkholderiales bacterium]|nr:hypothetical protein [Burkholderiales bacterium]